MESTIRVKLKDVEDFLEIDDCCCEDFKAELAQVVRDEAQG